MLIIVGLTAFLGLLIVFIVFGDHPLVTHTEGRDCAAHGFVGGDIAGDTVRLCPFTQSDNLGRRQQRYAAI